MEIFVVIAFAAIVGHANCIKFPEVTYKIRELIVVNWIVDADVLNERGVGVGVCDIKRFVDYKVTDTCGK